MMGRDMQEPRADGLAEKGSIAIALAPPRPVLLRVDDLHVEFRTRNGIVKAVNGLSYELKKAQTLAILGESGSGKTVSALAVMRILETPPAYVTRGTVMFSGNDLLRRPERDMRKVRGVRIAMVFQDALASLNPVFTVGFQIAEMYRRHLGISKADARRRAIEAMDRVQILNARTRFDDYPHQFSGGMRQRVMIAMALTLEPEIVIADEPTTALDVTVQAQIMQLLSDIQKDTGMGLILITHDLGVVAEFSDEVTVMYAGRVMERGTVDQIFDRPLHPYTMSLMKSIPRADKKGDRLSVIAGQPPNLAMIPRGCEFHPRCPLVRDHCRVVRPELRESSLQRASSCHYFEELARVD